MTSSAGTRSRQILKKKSETLNEPTYSVANDNNGVDTVKVFGEPEP